MSSEASYLRGVGESFIRAVASGDFARIEAYFRPDVRFRALIPPGVREASDASGAAAHLRRWFDDADSMELLWSEAGSVGDRATAAYRLSVHEPDGWKVVEQRLYCDLDKDGRIRTLDLLCSGFLPTEGPLPRP